MKRIIFTVIASLFSLGLLSQSTCPPISPLDCNNVAVGLPYALDFNTPVANTLSDFAGFGTGFTMALEHSEGRRSGDLPISDPSINGYEPSLLDLSSGLLSISSQAGIAYLDPPASSNNNNQVNTLGVGITDLLSSRLSIRATLNGIVTGGGSAQAGIWFGNDEDNFVKLNVNNNNNIELRVESGGASLGQLQTTLAISGSVVVLEMEPDPFTMSVEAFYTIDAGPRTSLGTLPVPADYFSGRLIGGTDMGFAGIYTTHRNGTQFVTNFESFDVEQQLSSDNDIVLFELAEQTGGSIIDVNNHTITVEVASGTDVSSLSPTIEVSTHAQVTPLSGTPQDFSAPFNYTVTAQDGTIQEWTVDVIVNSVLCPPISPLDCNNIAVGLPYALDFNTPVANTLSDFAGFGTGFTMALEHSEGRRSGDLPISDPSINGYEPSLLDLSSGLLSISSQAGIAYLDPPASSNNNNQVNTLGVGITDLLSSRLSIRATLNGIVTGGGSAQAGIWFGNDEDNFVKLNVNNNNNIELRVESGGASLGQLQTTLAISGSVVVLEMEPDPFTMSVEAFYTIDAGPRTSLGTLPVPADYFSGRLIGGTDMGFAGIYTTHRNGTQFVTNFESFDVEQQLSSDNDIVLFELAEQTGGSIIDVNNHTITVEVASGTDVSSLSPTIEVSTHAQVTPLSGTPQDFSAPFNYTVTAQDGSIQQWTVDVIVNSVLCSPISPLDCNNIAVGLPYALDFNTPVANTLSDFAGFGTGFTMALEHSEGRRSGDLPISDPSINGYEPSLLDLSSGLLSISSQAGIAYLDPPASSNNNNQVNTLGVGITDLLSSRLSIRATLNGIVTGGGSAQAGIWFGNDEDNFVKLNVNNNNNIELRVESGGASLGQLQTTLAISGSVVVLEMEPDPFTMSVEAFYTIDAGPRTSLGTLPVPADYFSGRLIGGTDMGFAGIYTTHRNGTQFVTNFESFDVEQQLSSDNDIVLFELAEQTGGSIIDVNNHTITVEVASGTDVSSLSPTIEVSTHAQVTPLSGTPQDFSAPFNYTVTAQDGSIQQWTVDVIVNSVLCSPISPLDCNNIAVGLPYALDFNTPVANTLSDFAGFGTGFTMALEHSEGRRSGDLPISDPSINGYEPSLLDLSSGLLSISSQAGIAYLDPPASSNNNNQVNTLGVGITDLSSSRLSIRATLNGIVTGGGSAQAGIWFGNDEDNFVKLNVNNNNNIELRVESGGASLGQLQTTLAISGSVVVLEMEPDPFTMSVEAFYTIDAGPRTSLGTLPVPADYFSGRLIGGTAMGFAGIYTTHRNGTQFVTNFESFDVEHLDSIFDISINYSDPLSTIPFGYYKDSGEPFGDRGNGYNYGWIDMQSRAPADLSKNGRRRNIEGVDLIGNTFIHMQYGNISNNSANGYLPDALWEIEVPNGTYSVKVTVGDPTVDMVQVNTPAHTINIEGFSVINNYVPTGNEGSPERFLTKTVIVNVSDGKITIDPSGGFNTKLNNINIVEIDTNSNPYFANVTPPNNSSNVSLSNFQLNIGLVVPNGYELDENTLNGNVKLFELNGNGSEVLIPTNSNDTGGGDAITLTPINSLKPLTTYIFRLNSNIEVNRIGDINDRLSFIAFESTFTTGLEEDEQIPERDLTGVEFIKVAGGPTLGEGTTGERFSSLEIGPDGKLYASTIGDFITDGKIFRWDINSDGTLTNLQILTPDLNGSPHPITGENNNNERLIIGFTFDPNSTAENLVAYVTHNKAAITNGPEWDGKISRLSGPDLSVVEDLVINLPRSSKDHLVNSITFDAMGDMYISVGSNSAGGEIDEVWANRPERLLSGAILKLDLEKLITLPLNAFTTQDISVINNASSTEITMSDGTYNPYAENSPLTIFATGIRNAYDLVWHRNGWLYIPTNGTAGNDINSPNSPSTSDYTLARRIDGLTSLPFVPSLVGGGTQKDWLFKSKGGSYHGHPNPYRGEFVLNHGGISYSGLPGQVEAAYIDVDKYPIDLGPDPNYLEPAYDFGKNKSPNGIIEYQSDAFNGKLQGLLMVTRFSGQDDLLVLDPKNNGDIAEAYNTIPGLSGGFDDPLDVVEDQATGNLYITEYDRDNNGTPRITLLRATIQATLGPKIVSVPNELIFEVTNNNEGENVETKSVKIKNTGNEELVISNSIIEGPFADQFNLISPLESTVLNPNESIDYIITYAPDMNGVNIGYQNASLMISSNALFNPVLDIGIFGLKKEGLGGTQEPILQDIVDVLGINIDVGWTSLTTDVDHTLKGEEVAIHTWVKASEGPVLITPMGRYSQSDELTFGWYVNQSPISYSQLGVLSEGLENAQTLFPSLTLGGTVFDPELAEFGLYISSPTYNTSHSQNSLNAQGHSHRARVYPVRNREGLAIENEYLVNFDEDGDGDYQDYIFKVENVMPFYSESLVFSIDSLEFIGSIHPEVVIPIQSVSLSSTTNVSENDITLTSTENWIILPDVDLDESMEIGINTSGLIPGTYQGVIIASTPDHNSARIDINLIVSEEFYTYNFNFQDPDATVISPSGYMDDLGIHFSTQTGENGNLNYGWVLPGTQVPADASANARNRNTPSNFDPLRNTLTIFGSYSQSSPTRDWMIEVPNGYYYVNLSVGDITASDSQHYLDVNGVRVINFDEENNNPNNLEFFENTELVEVVDGLMRISADPFAKNVKLNYVRIAEVNPNLLPPKITLNFEGNSSAPNIFKGSVDITVAVVGGTGTANINRIEYNLDDSNVVPYVNPISVSEPGVYILNVEAEDNKGNIAQITYSFTLEQEAGARILIENMTKIPGTNRSFPADNIYAFHRIEDPTFTEHGTLTLFHDTNVMRLHNNGSADLVISDIVIDDLDDFQYEIIPIPGKLSTYPLSIQPGEIRDVKIQFITDLGVTSDNSAHTSTIKIMSNADNGHLIKAQLNGSYQARPGGIRELSPQDVIDVFGFKTNMRSVVNKSGTIDPENLTPEVPNAEFPIESNVNAGYEGDLIFSPSFVQADPNKPVRAFQLAAFSGVSGGNSKFIKTNSTSIVGGMNFTRSQNWYNSILPRNNNGVISNDVSNSIGEPFRIQIEGRLSSGGTNTSGSNSHILSARFYKVRDAEGNIIPNEYIGIQDFVGGGGCGECDWNDNMFYYTNIRPVNLPFSTNSSVQEVVVSNFFQINFEQYFNRGFPGNEFTFSATLSDASPLPSWMRFNSVTNPGNLVGIPPTQSLGLTYEVLITARDMNGTIITSMIEINVVNEINSNLPWIENFSDLSNGSTNDAGNTGWSSSRSGGIFSVQNGEFFINDNGGTGTWTSEIISIDRPVNISIDINDDNNNEKESNDFIRAFYIVDGGSPVQFGSVVNDISAQTFSANNISGSTIQIIIEAKVSFDNEFYTFDNISVTGAATSLKYSLTGSNEVNRESNDLQLYPNPSSTEVWIEISNNEKISDILVYDSLGRLEAFVDIKILDSNKYNLDLTSFKAGIYFIILGNDKGKKYVKKLIINK